MQRCGWVSNDPLYQTYHDSEWGIAQTQSVALFEMLCLEGQQAGLSWITVLKKRENYRAAFYQFEPQAIARMEEADIDRLMQNSGLIRHRAKLSAIVANARAYLAMQENGEDFSRFVWSFVADQPQINQFADMAAVPAQTPVSVALSKALKKRGFKFVGATICYAFMQACGLVNDHLTTCFRHPCHQPR